MSNTSNRGLISTARLLPLALAFLICAGCRHHSTVVAVIPRTCGSWLWEPEHTGADREALHHGLSVYWNAPMRDDDVQSQIDILENEVKRKIAGVIIAPIEDFPLRTPLQRSIKAGLPVVVVDTDIGLPPGPQLSYVLNDERLGGQLAARRIGSLLHGKGSVAIMGINNRLSSTAEREHSLEATIADEFPGIHVVFRSLALPTAAQEQQVAEHMLANSQQPDSIVTLSETSTRGAFFALIEYHRSGTIPLVGFDQNLLAPIRTGEIDSVVMQNTYRMGLIAMRNLANQIAGDSVPATTTVPPQLVTKESIDSADVREALDMAWWRP